MAQRVTQADICTVAGVSDSTISRFEMGHQPEKLDRIVAAYEEECGLEPLELWERAIARAKQSTNNHPSH